MEQSRHVMSRQVVRERLVSLMEEIANVPIDRAAETATLDKDLRMESVVFVELYVAIEDEFQVDLDPLHIIELNQFGAIVDYVYRSVVRGAPPAFSSTLARTSVPVCKTR
jgi:acyl carrier protein